MKRRNALWFLLCTSVVLTACKKNARQPEAEPEVATASADASPVELVSPPIEAPLIWFHPMDGATGVGEVVAELRIQGTESIDSRLLQAIEDSVLLETAAGEAVRTHRVASRQEQQGSSADVTILPEEPLGPGAYVLRLPSLPAGVKAPRFPSHVTLPDGSLGVRFRVDSAPGLWGVRVCEKEKGTSLVVELTEEVLAPKAAAKAIRFESAAGPVSCTPLPHGDTETVGSLTFACDGFDPGAALEVTIAGGLESPAGAKLAASSHQFVPADVAPWGSGCRLYRSQR